MGALERTFQILPRSVTVTVDDTERAAGEPNLEFIATVDGHVNGDALSYWFSCDAADEPSMYDIVVTGDELQGNYRVAYAQER